MIELRHFIAQTLTEIVEGVVEAQAAVEKHGGKVSPGDRATRGLPRTESVEFDVQVTTEDSAASKKGVGVFVAPVAAGSQGVTESQRTSAGRIKFHVWVELPVPRASGNAS